MQAPEAKALAVLGAVAGLAVLGAVAGCAGPFRCPAAGGPDWRELVTEHFTLATDLVDEEAAVAVRDLEEYRAALLGTLFPGGGDPGGRVRVVILARERDWRTFEREREGVFTEALYQPFIAMRASASDRTRVTIRHELTHYLSRRRITQQPEWLSEGLATFFETMVYDREGGELLIGLPLPSRTAALRAGFSVRQTMLGSLRDQERDRFYATSWLIVHYLMSRQREPFGRYLAALERGQPSERAWPAAFPSLGVESLQAELRAHGSGTRPLVESRRFRAPPFTIARRTLDDASVHATRALLALGGRGAQAPPAARELARAEAAEALAADGDSLLALAVHTLALEQPLDPSVGLRATERHPDDWLAWAIRYRAEGGSLENEASRRAAATAVRLAAGTGVALPFGPPSPVWPISAAPSSRRCRPAPPGAPAALGAASRRCSDPADRQLEDARLAAVARSDVAWCLFEHQGPRIVSVSVDISADGQASSVCASAARPDDEAVACVERVLGSLRYPAPARCPAPLRLELTVGADGALTVFPR